MVRMFSGASKSFISACCYSRRDSSLSLFYVGPILSVVQYAKEAVHADISWLGMTSSRVPATITATLGGSANLSDTLSIVSMIANAAMGLSSAI